MMRLAFEELRFDLGKLKSPVEVTGLIEAVYLRGLHDGAALCSLGSHPDRLARAAKRFRQGLSLRKGDKR